MSGIVSLEFIDLKSNSNGILIAYIGLIVKCINSIPYFLLLSKPLVFL